MTKHDDVALDAALAEHGRWMEGSSSQRGQPVEWHAVREEPEGNCTCMSVHVSREERDRFLARKAMAAAIRAYEAHTRPEPVAATPGAEAAFAALDVADRLLERAYGTDVPAEWHEEYRGVAKARSAIASPAKASEGVDSYPDPSDLRDEMVARRIAEWLGFAWDGLSDGSIVERGYPIFTHGQFGWGFQGRKGDLLGFARELAALREASSAERELERALIDASNHAADAEAVRRERDEAEASKRRMEEALRPFATEFDRLQANFEGYEDLFDDNAAYCGGKFTIGHLRIARAALSDSPASASAGKIEGKEPREKADNEFEPEFAVALPSDGERQGDVIAAAKGEFHPSKISESERVAKASATRPAVTEAMREALIEKYALACRRNARELETIPRSVILQHFREFADEIAALQSAAPAQQEEPRP